MMARTPARTVRDCPPDTFWVRSGSSWRYYGAHARTQRFYVVDAGPDDTPTLSEDSPVRIDEVLASGTLARMRADTNFYHPVTPEREVVVIFSGGEEA